MDARFYFAWVVSALMASVPTAEGLYANRVSNHGRLCVSVELSHHYATSPYAIFRIDHGILYIFRFVLSMVN